MCRARRSAGRWIPLLTILLALPAGAAVLARMDDAGLTATAELILLGRCIETETDRLQGELVTRVTVTVEETWKGSAGERVSVLVPGGVDRSGPVPVVAVWSGAPQIVPGERMVLFLRSLPGTGGDHTVVGLAQGKLRVAPDGEGTPRVHRGDPREELAAFRRRIHSLTAREEER